MRDLRELSDAELRGEMERIGTALYRAEDLFAQMLLSGRLKAIHREISERPLWAVAK